MTQQVDLIQLRVEIIVGLQKHNIHHKIFSIAIASWPRMAHANKKKITWVNSSTEVSTIDCKGVNTNVIVLALVNQTARLPCLSIHYHHAPHLVAFVSEC